VYLISGLFGLFWLALLTLTFEKRLESGYWFLLPLISSVAAVVGMLSMSWQTYPLDAGLGGVGWPEVCFTVAASVVLIGVGIVVK
jgi:hypothetical protein